MVTIGESRLRVPDVLFLQIFGDGSFTLTTTPLMLLNTKNLVHMPHSSYRAPSTLKHKFCELLKLRGVNLWTSDNQAAVKGHLFMLHKTR